MCSYVLISSFFFPVSTHIGDVCICVSTCKYSKEYRSPASGTDCRRPYMYSCACSLSSHPIDLYPVMTCEYSQGENGSGRTALLWASCRGHAETVRVLVELGASVEAVDKVSIHAHALANTCCIQHVSGSMRMSMIIMSPAYACRCIYMHSFIHVYSYLSYTRVCICVHICSYVFAFFFL